MSTASRARQVLAAQSSVIEPIVLQYAEEAAFLWLLRDAAVRAPHYSLRDLARLDERIEAHLDGLFVAGHEGWRICVDELKWEEPGEVFAASAVAFASDDVSRMQPILEAVRQKPELARSMISALGFLPHQQVIGRIAQLSDSQSPDLRFIGLSASAIHRIDPGSALNQCLESDDARLRASARRAAGELGRRDLMPLLRAGLKDDDPTARLWAAWSLGLLGDRGVSDILREYAVTDSARWCDALNLAPRLTDLASANLWRVSLADDDATKRHAIVAAGAIGDPAAIGWLIEMMADQKLARVAGESFTTITGADLALLDLETPPPEDSGAGPTDAPEDENVAMDPDENLPWPDAGLIQKWWSANSKRLVPGKRYLLGGMIGTDTLSQALRDGKQRHRSAAAIELMLLNPKSTSPLFEVRSHSRVQQRALRTSPA